MDKELEVSYRGVLDTSNLDKPIEQEEELGVLDTPDLDKLNFSSIVERIKAIKLIKQEEGSDGSDPE